MPSLLLKNCHVVDPTRPAKKAEFTADILVKDGQIKSIAGSLKAKADQTIDAGGRLVTAGLVDLHVHLREPGREDKETIETATKAAAAGGVTTLLGMPNTNPSIDNQAAVRFVLDKARETGVVNVFTAGNLTRRGEGTEMAELWELKMNGVKVVTDDGTDIQNLGLYRKILQYCLTHGLTIMSHPENHDLKEGLCLHDGWVATQLGLPGNSAATETAHIAALLELIREVPTPFHFTHLSSARSVELIFAAKKEGLPVTCDVTPHHLLLSEEACLGFNTAAKVCPPLRDEPNRQQLLRQLAEGKIDAIATDHAPHTLVEKFVEFENAAVGIVGLETLFPLTYTHLVQTNIISLSKLVELLTFRPAEIIGVAAGRLAVGSTADIVIWDTTTKRTIDKNKFKTKGRNTPFHGFECFGFAAEVLVGGRQIVANGEMSV